MKESTRCYSRLLTNFFLACISIAAYLRLGQIFYLVIGLCTGAAAVFWLVRARSVGNEIAPPLANPQRVKRIAGICGLAGGLLLVAMLWRVQGEWTRLTDQGNLWLAMAWILLLSIAIFVPIELRTARRKN